ncbi:hypothetical protein HPP92_014792 [Vanilla planifolia]|uniref:Uncharacterized protein n=1 Tax=Vanilla planifolia TaxID=51239 RepID=A0A835QM84_VANPL|nr:hypothetical protein HPP92_014792 [Vanilla planifolia]
MQPASEPDQNLDAAGKGRKVRELLRRSTQTLGTNSSPKGNPNLQGEPLVVSVRKGKLATEGKNGENETNDVRANDVSGDEAIKFDPSRMIGIIKRKALIRDLAAAYHAECIACCQELLLLQKKWEEKYAERRASEETRKKTAKPSKRSKKG